MSSGRTYQLLIEWALPLAAVAATMGVLAFGAENARRVPPDVLPPVPVQTVPYPAVTQVETAPEGPDVVAATHPEALRLDRAEAGVARYIERSYRVSSDHAKLVTQWAVEIGEVKDLDPLLILAVVAVESSFNPHARSGAGAEGLMQVMTEVHLDKFRAFGGAGAALEAYPNMVVGSEILRGLIERTGSVSKALKWYSGAANHASDYGYGKKVLLERSRLVEAASGHPDKAVALLKSKRQGATYASSVKERKLSYEAWTNVREGRGLRVVTPSERRVEEPSV